MYCDYLVEFVTVARAGSLTQAASELSLKELEGQTFLHAQSQFDGEKINWEDTKYLLRKAGIDYRSKTCTLESKDDMLVEQRDEIVLLPEAYVGVEMVRTAGK